MKNDLHPNFQKASNLMFVSAIFEIVNRKKYCHRRNEIIISCFN